MKRKELSRTSASRCCASANLRRSRDSKPLSLRLRVELAIDSSTTSSGAHCALRPPLCIGGWKRPCDARTARSSHLSSESLRALARFGQDTTHKLQLVELVEEVPEVRRASWIEGRREGIERSGCCGARSDLLARSSALLPLDLDEPARRRSRWSKADLPSLAAGKTSRCWRSSARWRLASSR